MKRGILVAVAVSSITSALVTALLVTLGLPALAGAQETILRAERVVVSDADGNDRIDLSTGPQARTDVVVRSADGTRRVVLATGGPTGENPAAAGVTLFSINDVQIGRLGTFGPNTLGVNLILSDSEGRGRARVAVGDDGTAFIELYDANGEVIWRAP